MMGQTWGISPQPQFMMPSAFLGLMNPLPGQLKGIAPLQQRHIYAGRPIGDQGTTQTPQSDELRSTQANAQTGSSVGTTVGAEATAMLSSTASTMIGSLSTVGSRAMQNAHVLFTPPYSWMWRVGMSAASMKYDNLDKVADVPELMNLITGYYVGAPDAIRAAQTAELNSTDRFSLNSLTHMFQGPSSAAKTTDDSASADDFDSSSAYDPSFSHSAPSASKSTMPSLSSLFGGNNEHAPKDDYDDFMDKSKADEDNEDLAAEETPSSSTGSGLSNLFGNMLGGTEKNIPKKHVYPKAYPAAHSSGPSIWDLMNVGSKAAAGGGNSAMAQQLIKMAGPAMGIDPALVNMAAPMVASFL